MEKWTLKKRDFPDYLDGIRTDLVIEKGKYEPVAYAFDESQARLIAAAPEMYALVNRVAELNPDAGEIGAGMLVQLVVEARAARTKATQP